MIKFLDLMNFNLKGTTPNSTLNLDSLPKPNIPHQEGNNYQYRFPKPTNATQSSPHSSKHKLPNDYEGVFFIFFIQTTNVY